MNPNWPTGPGVYDLDQLQAKKRPPAVVKEPRGSTAGWLALCTSVGFASGLIAWALGGGSPDAATDEAAARPSPIATADALARDVTNFPFARSEASASPALQPSEPPALPFVVVRSWLDEDGERFVQLSRGGQGILARGLRVHGDYLVQVEQDTIEFTYLGATRRHSIPLPPPGQRPANSGNAASAQPWEYRPTRF